MLLTDTTNSQAPSSITSPLIPINYAKGRLHQRFVNVEYVNANAFNTQNNTSSPFSRLSMTFTVDDAGHLSPEEIIGEHERSVVDLIAIKGLVTFVTFTIFRLLTTCTHKSALWMLRS